VAEELYIGPKFETVFISRETPVHELLHFLKFWSQEFHKSGLTPSHEKGTAGNLSFRRQSGKKAFYITSAGLNSKTNLTKEDLVLVEDCDLLERKVFVRGSKLPSSESMMHHVIYETLLEVNAIFHGHNQWLLDNATSLGIPVTKNECEYGSEELVQSVMPMLGKVDFFLIKDHGFLSLGKNMDTAGKKALAVIKNMKTGR